MFHVRLGRKEATRECAQARHRFPRRTEDLPRIHAHRRGQSGILWRAAPFLTLGLLEDQVVSVAHTEQDEDIRIISIRKATKHEARFYFSQITD